ncbi:HPP family protein [Hirsutella rhossiliensis]|uniref:HPP family domain-containing protein n=1 Tax=Hirsutella rhossiliensis TaxID=111463 RepID=A0A9P8SIM0_9HYPO|nr:HPP family domain-containing protein [Hirsutella rhossiliensis]KAH0962765.1 HPP family domain-containing protein [Hirsutella rhossiliensis]
MRHRTWNLDIDRFLNPLVPSPPWPILPYPVAHFLGHRKTKPQETGNLMPIFWAFVGILCSILVIEAVTSRVPLFEARGVPMIVGSFGAAAVLEFYAIESPLAQPRNAIAGQLIATVAGVAIAKLFQLSSSFQELRWVGGALACASATALMALTKTVHPPAGATALLAVVDVNLVAVGWLLVPVMMLGCALMLAIALVVNNLERRFPMYWWTPLDLRQTEPAFTGESDGDGGKESGRRRDADDNAGRGKAEVVIRRGQVIVPEHMFLTQEEVQLLESMSFRL